MKNRKHILIVDDVTTNLRFIGEVLKDEYSLSMAKSGRQALKLLEKTIPDIILMDVKMPDMDGYETYSCIKGNKKTADIPVIFLTADTRKENEEKGLSLGASAFIHKPFDPKTLLDTVKDILISRDEENELNIIANKDQVTNLWNRRFLEKTFETYIEDGLDGIFVLLNLEEAREVNLSGKKIEENELLINFAGLFTSAFSKDAFISRIGGFEYAVLLKDNNGNSSYDSVTTIVDSLNEKVKDLLSIDNKVLFAGVSKFPENGKSFLEIYNTSDKAMYLSKNSSESEIEFYDPNVDLSELPSNNKKEIVEVSQLQSMIEDEETLLGPMVVDYEDFKDLYRLMKRYALRSGERLQLVLFTLKDLSGKNNEAALLKSMNVLETVIRSTFRKNDVASRYSQSQFFVILSDLSDDNRNEVIQRVTECFETTCENSDIIIKVDVEDATF